MNAHQFVLANAINAIRFVLMETLTDDTARYYWTSVLDTADEKVSSFTTGHKGGDVQAQFSNPLAYFLVPFYGHGLYAQGVTKNPPRGRSYGDTMRQLVACGVDNLTNRADKVLRLANDMTVEELAKASQYAKDGISMAFLKGCSHNKEIRGKLNQQSQLARQLRQIPDISADLEEIGFE